MMEESVAGAYLRLSLDRNAYLERYRDTASLTIPWLQQDIKSTASSTLQVPFQSMGARGVRNLSSKLMLALLPPGLPFFRLDVDPLALQRFLAEVPQENQKQLKAAQTQITESLRKVEESITGQTESGTIRSKVFMSIMQAMVGGSSLFQLRDDMTARVYNLQEFVLERDPSGALLRIITVENVSPTVLPEELYHLFDPDEKFCHLYTDIHRITEDEFLIQQELKETIINTPDIHSGKVKEEELSYIPMRFAAIDGESYGRSLIEENIGDLGALEGLSQAFLEMAASAARTIPLCDPTGVTRLNDLAGAPNLQWTFGRAQDVSTYTIDKRADLAAVRQEMIDLQESLKAVFLMTSSIQRQAERVTAEEIRTLTQELESTLGGVYSILAEEFQLPLVRRIMKIMRDNGSLSQELPTDMLKLSITTGVEGVGRGRDAQSLLGFAQGMAALYGPAALQQVLPLRDGAGRLANALGVDTSGFSSEEEMAAAAQAAQQAEAARMVGPDLAKAGIAQLQQQQNPDETTG